MGIEIERKFIVKELPKDLDKYPFHIIEQGYLNVHPAIRVRREDDIYYMTYKGSPSDASKDNTICGVDSKASQENNSGKIGKIEYNMPLDEASYNHMMAKADGNVIRKKRYLIPINEGAFDEEFLLANPNVKSAIDNGDIKIELDVFEAPFNGTILAEVEFPSEEAARAYHAAFWFLEDVTGNVEYSNSHMSSIKINT